MPDRTTKRREEPGIYDLGGTIEGEEALIAYDRNGECRVAHGVGAYHELESWLQARGVEVDSRPALFLI